jgi:hypothetical protein
VLGLPLTNMLIERLQVDKQLRRLCGLAAPQTDTEQVNARGRNDFAVGSTSPSMHASLPR